MKNYRKELRLSQEELTKLQEIAKRAGKTESAVIRDWINGRKIKEAPREEFYKDMFQLYGIANNIHQLTRYSHTFRYVPENDLQAALNEVQDFISKMEKKYLDPEAEDET